MIEATTLRSERRRFFLATKGAVVVPIAGTIFWSFLGVLGFWLTPRGWSVAILCAAVVVTPVAVLVFRKLTAHLLAKGFPLSGVIPAAMLPVALSLGLAGAAFTVDPSLVPLALIIGFALHWPVAGWMYGTPVYAIHAIVRVVLGVSVWHLAPDARFTWLPISIGVVYAFTTAAILRELRTAAGG